MQGIRTPKRLVKLPGLRKTSCSKLSVRPKPLHPASRSVPSPQSYLIELTPPAVQASSISLHTARCQTHAAICKDTMTALPKRKCSTIAGDCSGMPDAGYWWLPACTGSSIANCACRPWECSVSAWMEWVHWYIKRCAGKGSDAQVGGGRGGPSEGHV